MWEVIEIISVGCAGMLIGASYAYIKGYDRGYKQGYEWHKKEEMTGERWG